MLLDSFRMLGLPLWVAVVGCRGVTMLGLVRCGIWGRGMRIGSACLSTDQGRQIRKYGTFRRGRARTIICRHAVQPESDTMSGRLSEKL
ncbi:hypothetical protein BJV78DRAFT_1245233, partial [Lactifluus subvellereus]